MIRDRLTYGFIAALLASGVATTAFAIDTDPGDYTPLPAGTNLAAFYLAHSYSDTLDYGDAGEIPGSELRSTLFVGRFVHYFEFNGMPGSVQAFLPLARFHDARIGGVDQPLSEGIGDLTLGASLSPISASPDVLTGTNLGATLFLSLPTGNYEFGEVSIGSGTTTFTPQIGFQQGLGGGLFFDAYYDMAFALDHEEEGYEVETDPSRQLQLYIRYEFKPGFNAAIGYSGKRGGKQYVDDAYTGLATRSDQIRVWGSAFLNPTTQLGGRIAYDTRTEDGFKAGPIFQLRLVKLF